VALVTGGSRGIGAAISRELARAGAKVAVNCRSGTDAAEQVADEIGGVAVPADVSNPEEAQALIERVEGELGDIDALVNNAGVTRDTLIARMSDDDWQTVIDTNLRGTFNTARAVSRKMMRRRAGSIVNLSSVVGIHGNSGQANYAASKAGIIGLTKALARELGSRGVRVNAIAPGYITTELTDVLNDEQRGLILGNTPLGRLGEPEDVAGAVRFLCSDDAAFITGEVLLVDGGLGM
jgi:3-oxoacyl-[acyl-carrier protein] reductase